MSCLSLPRHPELGHGIAANHTPRHPELVSGSKAARARVHVILKQVQNDGLCDACLYNDDLFNNDRHMLALEGAL